MPVRRFNLVFIAQRVRRWFWLWWVIPLSPIHPAVSVGAPTLRRSRFFIFLLLAVLAVAIAMIILKQFQIAKKLLTASSFPTKQLLNSHNYI